MKFWFDKEFEEFLTYTENNKTAIFPISKSICSLWHSGIHLTDGNKPIKNLLGGKIIASSFDEKYKELKLDDYVKKVSGSFILVQHSFNLDKKEYNFYILYAGLLPYENYFFFKDSKYTKKVQSDYSSYSLNKDFPFLLANCIPSISFLPPEAESPEAGSNTPILTTFSPEAAPEVPGAI